MSIRLIVVEDHTVVRRGLESVLEGSDIEIVGEAANCEEAVSLARLIPAQIVLLDLRLPDEDALSCLGRMTREKPDLKFLLYTAYGNPKDVSRAISLGVAGLVDKGEPSEVLIDAIRGVAAGETRWSREELRRVTSTHSPTGSQAAAEASLTQRENEVLVQLTSGQTNKEIAQTLGISYETVKEHVQHILRKLGVSDRTQAAIWAVRNGLA